MASTRFERSHRCGILMAMRSMKTSGITGIVVTASHNPAEDNGVKLIEPTGYMLTQSWEVSSPSFKKPKSTDAHENKGDCGNSTFCNPAHNGGILSLWEHPEIPCTVLQSAILMLQRASSLFTALQSAV